VDLTPRVKRDQNETKRKADVQRVCLAGEKRSQNYRKKRHRAYTRGITVPHWYTRRKRQRETRRGFKVKGVRLISSGAPIKSIDSMWEATADGRTLGRERKKTGPERSARK